MTAQTDQRPGDIELLNLILASGTHGIGNAALRKATGRTGTAITCATRRLRAAFLIESTHPNGGNPRARWGSPGTEAAYLADAAANAVRLDLYRAMAVERKRVAKQEAYEKKVALAAWVEPRRFASVWDYGRGVAV